MTPAVETGRGPPGADRGRGPVQARTGSRRRDAHPARTARALPTIERTSELPGAWPAMQLLHFKDGDWREADEEDDE